MSTNLGERDVHLSSVFASNSVENKLKINNKRNENEARETPVSLDFSRSMNVIVILSKDYKFS